MLVTLHIVDSIVSLGRWMDRSQLHCKVEELWRDRLADLYLTIVSNLNFGHSGNNDALTVRCLAELDGYWGILSWFYPHS